MIDFRWITSFLFIEDALHFYMINKLIYNTRSDILEISAKNVLSTLQNANLFCCFPKLSSIFIDNVGALTRDTFYSCLSQNIEKYSLGNITSVWHRCTDVPMRLTLQILHLSNISQSCTTEVVGCICVHCPQLVELSLFSCVGVSYSHSMVLLSRLEKLRKFTITKSRSLRALRIPELPLEAYYAVTGQPAHSFSSNSMLHDLCIENCSLFSSVNINFESLMTCNLSGTSVTAKTVHALVEVNPGLKKLILVQCLEITSLFIESISGQLELLDVTSCACLNSLTVNVSPKSSVFRSPQITFSNMFLQALHCDELKFLRVSSDNLLGLNLMMLRKLECMYLECPRLMSLDIRGCVSLGCKPLACCSSTLNKCSCGRAHECLRRASSIIEVDNGGRNDAAISSACASLPLDAVLVPPSSTQDTNGSRYDIQNDYCHSSSAIHTEHTSSFFPSADSQNSSYDSLSSLVEGCDIRGGGRGVHGGRDYPTEGAGVDSNACGGIVFLNKTTGASTSIPHSSLDTECHECNHSSCLIDMTDLTPQQQHWRCILEGCPLLRMPRRMRAKSYARTDTVCAQNGVRGVHIEGSGFALDVH